MKPPVVHDGLVSHTGALLAPEDSMEIHGSQQQVPNETNEVTLLMKLVLEEALPQEQLQHILGPYLEELFDAPLLPPKEQPTTELAAETKEGDAVSEPEFLAKKIQGLAGVDDGVQSGI
ncbi:uncharacterized protein LOC123365851 isoform X2 [Mauremys mutica]|uniref:uncharacterized protein LOC123365851 isoform X2 n=1 Tax=Mauremys mutica TaxID=74926 RepID=UPI001D163F76|nr:uncharacterized protein LOC123365851 isoform X2 [Mauremys mutica]